ncbi:MAG: hypothetical protein AB8F74_06720 [Saprospiraceae bacterium]
MKRNYQSPLDMEDQPESPELSSSRRSKIWFYLEWIPITLLSVGVLLRSKGSDWWPFFMIGGGVAVAIIYVLFSTALLNAAKESTLERTLAIVSGLLVAFGVLSLFAKYQYWDAAPQLVMTSIYGGLGLIALVAIVFLTKIRQPQSAKFYRGLLARLFIFVALVYSLGF